MIGKPVTGQELETLLLENERSRALKKELEGELASMKPGECLLYETNEGNESILSLALSLTPTKDLLIIKRPGKVYVYKEKKK